MKNKIQQLRTAFSKSKASVLMLILGLSMFASLNSFAQSVTMAFQAGGFDNCMSPTPNAGTYNLAGTLNGKNYYTKGSNLRIIWTGSQWELQADNPGGTVVWSAGWYNTKNTATPPADCWQASFGCFAIILSGPDAYPFVTISSIALVNPNPSSAPTVNYTVTFSGTINSLSTSNFSIATTGTISGASITSVNQTSGNVWNVSVSTGSGEGNISLSMINATGASGSLCSFPAGNATYNIFKTTAPVTLTAGDIAFTGYNSSSATVDDFSFVVLKSGGLPAGTKIMFSDNGWNNVAGSCTANEGIVMWTASSAVAQFAPVRIAVTIGASYTVNTGTTTNITSSLMNLSNAGDQVLAFQGNLATPTFISAINMNAETTGTMSTLAGWDDFANGASTSRSFIPTGLTNGVNALMVATGSAAPFTEFDNAVYNCTGAAAAASVSAMRASINDRNNWTTQDLTAFTIPPGCTFSLAVTTTVLTTGTLSTFTTCSGTASSPQSFSVSGAGLTANLDVTAPAGFQLALSAGGSYANSLSLTPSGGTVSSTAIFVRLSSSASGTPSGNITSASTGATTQNVAASGTVNTLPTVTANAVSGCAGSAIALSGTPAGGTWSVANPYTGSTTTYTHTFTNGNGCTNTSSSATITVNALPTVTAANVSGCAGSPIALSGTPAGGTWSVGNPYSGPSISYTHTYTDGNGCSNTSSSANITVNSRPTGVLSGTSYLCTGSSATLSIAATGSGIISGTLSDGTTYSGIAPTITVNVSPVSNTTYSISTMSDGNCNSNAGDLTGSATVTINSLPTAAISNNSRICLGQPASIHLAFTGTGPWNYTISDGSQIVSGSSSVNHANVNIIPVSGGTHNYIVTVVSDANCTGNGSGAAVVKVSTAPPLNNAGNVNGPPDGACENDVELITTSTVAGQHISYSWNTGSNSSSVKFSGSSSGPFVNGPFETATPSVYAQFGLLAGASGYDICVQGVNGCGSTNNKCSWIRGVVSVPGTITPAANAVACAGDVKSYVCGISTGATIYNWTLSGSAAAITSGQGTQNVQVTFPPAFTSGQLCVNASLSCAGSSTSAQRCMTISNNPSLPAMFTEGPSKVCPGSTNVLYSVPAVTGATGYNWTVPPGATIVETPPYTNSIHVNFPNPYPNSPAVYVYATSPCGSSLGRYISVSSALPVVPGAIEGPTTNVCNSTVQYSISSVVLALDYTWTLPPGATNIIGQGSQTVQFNVPSNFTSGYVTVVANSATCAPATSPARTITINGAPSIPAVITANPAAWCNNGFANFSVATVSPLPQYIWTAPNGIITAGQNTNNIDVTWGTGAGNVTVRAYNTCGASSIRTQNFTTSCREQENQPAAGSHQLTVFPNPAHDKATVSIDAKKNSILNIKLIDIAGRTVLAENREGNAGVNLYELDLTHFSKGVYLLRVSSGDMNRNMKIVIE